eukprot:scaffold33832_cov33-Phaeocystis_antarctica.AAC.2
MDFPVNSRSRARSAHPVDAELVARRPVASMAAGGCHPPAGRAAGCEVCVQEWFSGRLVPASATQEKMGHQPWPWPTIRRRRSS